jgi:large subunit ribosomal protein L31
MKESIHPNYRPVVFMDIASGFKLLNGSTQPSDETVKWEDGKDYPLIKVEISSASHPFFTGQDRLIDAEGRVEKFRKKFKLKT